MHEGRTHRAIEMVVETLAHARAKTTALEPRDLMRTVDFERLFKLADDPFILDAVVHSAIQAEVSVAEGVLRVKRGERFN